MRKTIQSKHRGVEKAAANPQTTKFSRMRNHEIASWIAWAGAAYRQLGPISTNAATHAD